MAKKKNRNIVILKNIEDFTIKDYITKIFSTLNYWSDKYANMINGTDGTLNAPFISNYFLR